VTRTLCSFYGISDKPPHFAPVPERPPQFVAVIKKEIKLFIERSESEGLPSADYVRREKVDGKGIIKALPSMDEGMVDNESKMKLVEHRGRYGGGEKGKPVQMSLQLQGTGKRPHPTRGTCYPEP